MPLRLPHHTALVCDCVLQGELKRMASVCPRQTEASFFMTPNLEGALAVTERTLKDEDQDRAKHLRDVAIKRIMSSKSE